MKTPTQKALACLAALTVAMCAAFFTTGCVCVKHAEIKSSTFNTSGWKSNAGGADQAIDAANDVAAEASGI